MTKASILIVEDNAILALDLQEILSRQGYTVAGLLASGEEALDFLSGKQVDLVLMDIELAGEMNGINTAERLHGTSDIPVVFMTGFSQDPLLEEAKIAAPYGYLIKPVPERELAATLEMALHRHRLDRELRESRSAFAKSEERLRMAQCAAHCGSWEWNLLTNENIWSDELWKLYDLEPKSCESSYKTWLQVIHPDDRIRVEEIVRKAASGKSELNVEWRIIQSDGSIRWLMSRGKPFFDEKGQATHYLGIVIDITERKKAEEVIQDRIVALTQPLNGIAITIEELFSLDEMQRIQDEFAAATGVASIITRPDGTPHTAPTNFTRLCNDIIRKTEQGCANCYKSDAIIGRYNPEGPIVQPCLSGGLWDAGVSINVGGHHIANWLIGQVRNETQSEESMRAYAVAIGADEAAFMQAFYDVPAMSSERFQQIAKLLFTLANQLSSRAYQNVQQARYISERQRTEEKIRRDEARLRRLVDILQHPSETIQDVLDSALDQAIQLTESKIGYIYHYHEDRREFVLNSWSRDVLPACTVAKPQTCYELAGTGLWGEAVRQRQPIIDNDFQSAHPLKKGYPEGHVQLFKFMTIPVFKGENIVGVVGLANKESDYDQTDILQISLLMETVWKIIEGMRAEEEHEKLNAQLQQARKMEAIGTLAGGIAHDFNNILGAILGYAEMAYEDSLVGTVNPGDLDHVLQAGNRAKDLVKQILAFSRQAETLRIPLRPAALIKESVKLLRSSIPSTIDIRQDIDAEADLVLADPTQIHQILMNLCTNAYHAMEETGGVLTISLKNKMLSRPESDSYPSVQPGAFVHLSVSDTGQGVSPEIRERIFDPYFTTKEVGKGTGMGLAIVHGIVQRYGGFIDCRSVIGEGTVFNVNLPVLAEVSLPEAATDLIIPVGRESILFVDDEEILAEMAQSMLTRLGYTVTVRTTSLETLATFENQPDAFDLVITDQTMPGMTGLDLARRMLLIRPDLPIILCTGYSSQVSEEQARSAGIRGFALKPMAKADLAALIRKVLDQGDRAGEALKGR